MAHDVFISHSSKDKAIADAVCAALETTKIRCWIAPRDIQPGEKWAESIEKAINSTRIMVLIYSSQFNNSEVAKSEVSMAFSSNVILIPFRIENIEPTGEMRLYLMRTHWLDAANPPTKEQIQKLVETTSNLMISERHGGVYISEEEDPKMEKEANERLRIEDEERKEREKKSDIEKRYDKKPAEYNSILISIFMIAVILGILIMGYWVFTNSEMKSTLTSILTNTSASTAKPVSTPMANSKNLSVSERWDIDNGWTLSIVAVDVKKSPNRVYLILEKNQSKWDEEIVTVGSVYNYKNIFRVTVSSIFIGPENYMVSLTNLSLGFQP